MTAKIRPIQKWRLRWQNLKRLLTRLEHVEFHDGQVTFIPHRYKLRIVDTYRIGLFGGRTHIEREFTLSYLRSVNYQERIVKGGERYVVPIQVREEHPRLYPKDGIIIGQLYDRLARRVRQEEWDR